MKYLINSGPSIKGYASKQASWHGFKQLLLSMAMVLLFAQITVAGPHPNMYLNQVEIDGINGKVAAETEPWFSSYTQVMAAANVLLNAPVDPLEPYLSVTYQLNSSNIYRTISPYCGWTAVDGNAPDCRGGQLNPAVNRGDYNAAIALGNAVRDLGLAYAFTGNAAYAEKAINYIRVWSINSETRMAPQHNVSIELYITMPGYFYGADLIWDYAGWDPAEKTAFRSWVKTIAETVKTQQVSAIASAVDNNGNPTATNLNNFANWRNVLIGAAGAMLDDQGLLDYMEGAWKHLIWVQMNGAGSQYPGYLGQEVTRPRGLHYTLYAINAMLQGAEIMRHRGVNLYDYEGPGGTSLRLTLDFVTPFARESCLPPPAAPCSWMQTSNRKQITEITQNDSMAMYELAYSYYQDLDYLEVINHWGRPMDEIRIMGNNTLTHANLFELDMEPVPAAVVTHPEPVTVAEGGAASFSVVAVGDLPLLYQWFRGGAVIEGAEMASYTLDPVLAADDEAMFYVRVSNNLGTVNSNTVELTVVSDTTAPEISGSAVLSPTLVNIVFSEPVTVASAQTLGNYQIDQGIQILGASLGADERTVSLQTGSLQPGVAYTVMVTGIRDQSSAGNEIESGSSVSILFEPSMGFDNGQLPFNWTPFTQSRWSVEPVNGDNALFLNTTAYSPESGLRLGEYILAPDSYADFSLKVDARSNEPVGTVNADYALVFGFLDGNNYYYMLFNTVLANTKLSVIVAGERTDLKTASQGLTGNDYNAVEVKRLGDIIEVWFDGTMVLQVTDTTYMTGRVGLGSFNDSAYFDNIRITAGAGSISDIIFADQFEQP
ncbi:MAG: alginate lyase family protein [Xanthomonadales bacterium]|nr:alginate lyase family protein [Xanthomonadales bacterium]